MDAQVYTFLLQVDGSLVIMFNPSKNRPTGSITLSGAQWMGISITLYSLDRSMDKINEQGTRLAKFLMDMFMVHSVEVKGDLMVRIHVEDPYPVESLVGTRKNHVEKVLDDVLGFCAMKAAGEMPEAMKAWLDSMSQQGPKMASTVAEGVNHWCHVVSRSNE